MVFCPGLFFRRLGSLLMVDIRLSYLEQVLSHFDPIHGIMRHLIYWFDRF
jgi:hypothetical protein